ncbi:hypothetical protein OG453_44070 [Streptomyces sp. NBC_01381]|uniref:hypothetical protein n=1 Tax=Streptomyces sp. NBC_01381 TaxID=2903845 RepID=UPI0022596DAF|nr:hypothetical protein [Streptomyces sp. NBC_01381]MCX4673539.1 hypothetical protein [Streptomyces sp. NBC_01381]
MSLGSNDAHPTPPQAIAPPRAARRDLPRQEGPGRVTLEVHARRISATGSAAVLSNSLLVTGLISGQIPATPTLAWPLVALSIASMAYDLGRKAITHDRL